MLTRILAICGQITRILCSAAWRFNELKAFLVSTKIPPASVLSSSNMHRIDAYTPDCNPVALWRGPAASWISSFSTQPRHLPTILLKTSPTPIGLTPGFLSSGISPHGIQVSNVKRPNVLVANFLVKIAVFLVFNLVFATWRQAILHCI